MRGEQPRERRERIVENPVQIETLELRRRQNGSDIFNLQDERPVVRQQSLHGLDKSTRILKMGEDAAGNDNIRPSMGFFDRLGGRNVEEGRERFETLIVGDLRYVDRRLDAGGFATQL